MKNNLYSKPNPGEIRFFIEQHEYYKFILQLSYHRLSYFIDSFTQNDASKFSSSFCLIQHKSYDE